MKICYFFGHDLKKNPKAASHYNRFACTRCDESTEYSHEKWRHTFWKSDEWDTIKFFGKLVLVFLVSLAVIVGVIVITGKASCNQYAEMGIPTMWKFWTGCMANHPQYGWVPVEKYFEILNLFVK